MILTQRHDFINYLIYTQINYLYSDIVKLYFLLHLKIIYYAKRIIYLHCDTDNLLL